MTLARVVRKKKPVSTGTLSFPVVLSIISGALCVSYPLLAPISGWAQGNNLPSLENYKHADKLMQIYYTGLLHIQMNENHNAFMDKLGHWDAFSRMSHVQSHVQASKQTKRYGLKKINIGGFFVSLFMFICLAGSGVLSILLSLLLFSLMVMNVIPFLFVTMCLILVVLQWKLWLHNVIQSRPQGGKHLWQCTLGRSRSNLHRCAFFGKIVVLCVTVYIKVYFSHPTSKLRSLITKLLVMSGDVETNPGPPPDNPQKTSTSAGNERPTFSKSYSIDSSQKNCTDTGLPVPGPVVCQSSGDSTHRKQNILAAVSDTATVDSSDIILLKENVDKINDVHVTTSPLEGETKPIAEHRHEQEKSSMVLSKDDGQVNQHQAAGQTIPYSREFSGTSNENAMFVYLEKPHRRCASYDKRDRTRPKLTFTPLIEMVCKANKKYLLEQRHNKCPMCWTECKKPSRSHIIPAGVLKVFKRIWCSNNRDEFKDFIYHFEKKSTIKADSWKQQLFCQDCEEICSKHEEKLRNVYIQIMSKPDCPGFSFRNEECWFDYVLANIMFRGLLVNVDLSEHLENKDFVQAFTILWNYCLLSEYEHRQKLNPLHTPGLRVFLLPSKPIFKLDLELHYLTEPVEHFLRNPQQTTHHNCQIGENLMISFLYTKFDCFHVVLPLGKKSKEHFDQYDNGCYEEDGKYMLQWTKPTKVFTQHFPEVLFRATFAEYDRFLRRIREEKHKLRRHSRVLAAKPKLGQLKSKRQKQEEEGADQLLVTDLTVSCTESEYDQMIEKAAERALHYSSLKKITSMEDELRSVKDELKSSQAKVKHFENTLKRPVILRSESIRSATDLEETSVIQRSISK